MGRICDILGGAYHLVRLGVLLRFRFGGEYWQWRMHTALGDASPSKVELWRAAWDFGVWMHRVRR